MAKINRKTIVLRFEDDDFAGVEIRAYPTSMGRALELVDEAGAARRGAGLTEVSRLIDEFAQALQSWNLDNVPATREGLLSLDIPDVMTILLTWFDSMIAITGDLGKGSTSGTPFPEVSIPMEIPSPNLTNSPMPN
jgi:hypothetical protein